MRDNLLAIPDDENENPARMRDIARTLIGCKRDIVMKIAVQIKTNIKTRLRLVFHGNGRGAKIAIAAKDNVKTLRRGCDNKPVEPAAIQAAPRENTTRKVSPKPNFFSCRESLTSPSDCNSLLWLT